MGILDTPAPPFDPSARTDGYLTKWSQAQGRFVGSRGSGWFNAADYAGGSNGAAGQIAQALADAAAAVSATRGATVYLPAGLYNCAGGGSIAGAVAALPRNTVNWIRILLDDGAYVRLSSLIPRFLDLGKVADHDIFNKFLIEGGTIDANNVGGNDHVVLGSLAGGSFLTRFGVDRVAIRGLNTVNVPSDSTGNVNCRRNVSLVCVHPAASEATQDRLTNVLLEDCDFQGGNYGAQVNGIVASAVSLTDPAPNRANIWISDIRFIRCFHDTLVLPTILPPGGAGGLFIGSQAQGERALISDCHVRNSFDIGLEIDGLQQMVVEKSSATDCHIPFLTRNFREPIDQETQVATFRDCTVVHKNLLPSANIRATGFLIDGDSVNLPGLGHTVIENSSYRRTSTGEWTSYLRGWAIRSNLNNTLRVTVRNFRISEGAGTINPNGGADIVGTALYFGPNNFMTLTLDNIYVHSRVTRKAGAANKIDWQVLGLNGKFRFIDVDRVRVNASITNGDTVRFLIMGEGTSSVRSATFRRVALETLDANGLAGAVQIGASIFSSASLNVITGLKFEDWDMWGLGAAGGTRSPFIFASNDPVIMALTKMEGIKLPVAPTAIAAVAVTTGAPSDATHFVYQNLDYGPVNLIIQGGTVTNIEIARGQAPSASASTGYVSTGLTSGAVPLSFGDVLRVTYSVAPTITKVIAK